MIGMMSSTAVSNSERLWQQLHVEKRCQRKKLDSVGRLLLIAAASRCVILILYHAAGRGGEVSTSTWNSAQWEDNCEFLSLDWGELKKGQQYIMTFHLDAKGWELDVYHATACYLIGGR